MRILKDEIYLTSLQGVLNNIAIDSIDQAVIFDMELEKSHRGQWEQNKIKTTTDFWCAIAHPAQTNLIKKQKFCAAKHTKIPHSSLLIPNSQKVLP